VAIVGFDGERLVDIGDELMFFLDRVPLFMLILRLKHNILLMLDRAGTMLAR
jgi:hypothetical protein